MRRFAIKYGALGAIILLAVLSVAQPVLGADLERASGKLKLLRVQNSGGYGPQHDFLDVEVVVKLANHPQLAVGLRLRNDAQQPANEAMLALLRDALRNDWPVTIEYWIEPGRNTGMIHRVGVVR